MTNSIEEENLGRNCPPIPLEFIAQALPIDLRLLQSLFAPFASQKSLSQFHNWPRKGQSPSFIQKRKLTLYAKEVDLQQDIFFRWVIRD